jgi:hypothetical protein
MTNGWLTKDIGNTLEKIGGLSRQEAALGQPLSHPPCQTGGMKIKNSFNSNRSFFNLRNGYRIVAAFGATQLIRKSDGRYELLGGSAHDHAEAREWCSLFAPEIVFTGARKTRVMSFAA